MHEADSFPLYTVCDFLLSINGYPTKRPTIWHLPICAFVQRNREIEPAGYNTIVVSQINVVMDQNRTCVLALKQTNMNYFYDIFRVKKCRRPETPYTYPH